MIRLALIAWLALCGVANAQMSGGVGGFPGPGTVHSTGVTFALDFTGNAEDNVAGTTTTFSSVAIGAADTNRIVAVGAAYRANDDTTTISSVTIGGVSATKVAGATATRGDGGNFFTNIWYAAVPTGTTANVVVNFSASIPRSAVAAYRIITSTPAPSSSSFGIGASTNATTGSITVPGGGAGFAMVGTRNGSVPVTWTNATSDYSATVGVTLATVGGAKFTATNTITGTPNGGSGVSISGAAWSP